MSHQSFRFWLSCLLMAAAAVAWAEPHKLKVTDPALASSLKNRGGRLLADYGAYQVIEAESSTLTGNLLKNAENVDRFNFIQLSARRLDTRRLELKAMHPSLRPFAGRRLYLIQFVGPVKPEWRAALEQTGVRVVNYLPHNAYLVQGNSSELARLQAWAAGEPAVQWDGEYRSDYKVHRKARAFDEQGKPRNIGTDLFAIQLTTNDDANEATLKLIGQLQSAPILRQSGWLGFQNVVVPVPAERLDEIAARPDVISIQPYFAPRKLDERQDQILAGNLSGNLPSGPGYLAWLAGRGFTQAQFDASGFVVDVSDSGIDNGTTTPAHFALFRSGNPLAGSRVAYSRLEGRANPGGTLRGCDGHGTLNAQIIAGYDDLSGTLIHTDAEGYNYGLGVCPFVRVGASVIFDPDDFTFPNYTNLLTRAYNSGARISNNSWGGDGGGDYDIDAQAYDALVRDVGAGTNNRAMSLIFVAGNSGPDAQTIATPGTAKNVITVGGSENVRSLHPSDGGNSSVGSDGCGAFDDDADDAEDLVFFSSRGPCADGRMKPDLVAPATHVTGGAPQGGVATTNGVGVGLACFNASAVCALNTTTSFVAGSISNFFPLGQQFYTVSSGTSHAAPAVSGASALLRQRFINQGMAAPSPAMTKACLMNSTRYLTGNDAADTLWSPNQGMGALNLGMALDDTPRVLLDQLATNILTAAGQIRRFTCAVSDPMKPVRVTLAWTDAPGSTAAASALVNDLDLAVVAGGRTYRGNVFNGAYSVTGGSSDLLNNVESVFLPANSEGTFLVSVTAADIVADAITLGRATPRQDFALVIYNATLVSAPFISGADFSVTSENCAPGNGGVDPGETVTVDFSLENLGSADVAGLVATLLETNGVVAPSGSQSYGAVAAGSSATRAFTFTASGNCDETLSAVLQLQDGIVDLGTVTFSIPLGALATFYAQDFDGVGLPPGWTTSAGGAQKKWTISKLSADTLPAAAFSGEAGSAGVNTLVSPAVTLASGKAQLSFRHKYNLETAGSYGADGGVLEIKIGYAPFLDILAAGGSFVSGGYNRTIYNNPALLNPLRGRAAWSGDSDEFITTVVDLPASAAGQTVQFQWRCGTDSSRSGAGWFVDSVRLTGFWCCPGDPPAVQYTPATATYAGLFFDTNGVQLESSGAITLKTTRTGPYSGKLQSGTKKYSFSGQFGAFGFASNYLALNLTNSLTLLMQLDAEDGGRITGTVAGGSWQASLLADRAVFNAKTNPAPYAGKYTLAFPGSGDVANTNLPFGDGFGTVTVDASGKVRLGGSLADGTKLSQTATVSAGGLWPLYIPLYKGRGHLLGWLTFVNGSPDELNGEFSWIKIGAPTDRFYPAGFGVLTNVVGAAYLPPVLSTGPILNFTNGTVTLSGGNLATDLGADVVIGGGNRVFNVTSNKLSLTLTATSGLFKGMVPDPVTGRAIRFNGVVFQAMTNYGTGYFLGTNQSGRVVFNSRP